MDSISIFGTGYANEEIIGFDITIDERLVMDRLYTGYLFENNQFTSRGVLKALVKTYVVGIQACLSV